MVICAEEYSKERFTCNFLIHPIVRIADHDTFAAKICGHLNFIIACYDDDAFVAELKKAWNDLRQTQPDIVNFDDMKSIVTMLLENAQIQPLVLNSQSPIDTNYKSGYNIVIGGNILGRGITLPRLQVVYYCRKSKAPQADTFWQHSRMFGYDRTPGLMRIFIPQNLHKLFYNLNKSNNILINQIKEKGLEGIQILLPEGIKPTRSNVVDRSELSIITGGVNYSPDNPSELNTDMLDAILANFRDDEPYYTVSIDVILSLLSKIGDCELIDWDRNKFINCSKALSTQRPHTACKLIVRKNRNISKGTRTLLSPPDRKLGDSYPDALTLTLYRVNGDSEKGWSGCPIWIPNIKFPQDTCYYDIKG